MIRRVHIWNFGPFTDYELALKPSAPNLLVGASHSGKSSIMEAVSLCLFGTWSNGDAFPVHYIRNGAKGAAVEMELSNGTILRKTITASGIQKREIVRGGESFLFTSESAFYAAIPTPVLDADSPEVRATKQHFAKVWSNQDLVRFIVFPQERYWAAWFKGNAREVRDILLSAMPGIDPSAVVVEEMRKAGYADFDPKGILSEKDAETAGRAANSGAKAAESAVAQARTAKEDADKALANVKPAGEEPPDVKADLEKAQKEHATLKADLASKGLAHNTIKSLLDNNKAERVRVNSVDFTPNRDEDNKRIRAEAALEQARKDLASLPADDSCPTCGNQNWSYASARRADLEQAVKDATEAFAAIMADLESAKSEWEIDHDKHLAKVEEAITNDEKKLTAAITSGNAIRAKMNDLEAKLKDLGARHQTRLTWEAATDASIETLEQTCEKAAQRLKEATDAKTQADAKAARSKALLDAVRAAPTIIANKNATAFDNIANQVRVVFDDKTTSLLLNTKAGFVAWNKGATDGQKVVADYILRAFLRFKCRMPLPIFVNNINLDDGDGHNIPAKGCVVLMLTDKVTNPPVVK